MNLLLGEKRKKRLLLTCLTGHLDRYSTFCLLNLQDAGDICKHPGLWPTASEMFLPSAVS